VDGVRCTWLSAETLDEVLPAADRAPVPSSIRSEPAALPTPPAFPPLAEGLPLPVARLSYSALESYKRCGYRFYLERVVKMRRPGEELVAEVPVEDGDQLALSATAVAPDQMSPLVRGTIVHELLERIDFRSPEPPARAEIERQVEANMVRASEDELREIASLIEGFLSSDLFARLREAQRVQRELPFAYPLEPTGLGGRSLLVNGVVDVHADFGDHLLVVDYKTDALEGRDPEEVCDEKYSGQRLVYALAALRSGAAEVEVAYCFLERPDLVVSRRFGAAERERLEAELLDLAAGVISGSFAPTDSPHRELCQSCPGQPALCSWPPDRTLAERPEGETFAAPEPERQLS
jgi:ATP-dependent helicase/nuclease subunit A